MTNSRAARAFLVTAMTAVALTAGSRPALAVPSSDPPKTVSVPVTVKSTQAYTDSGLRLLLGEPVTIRATGRITFSGVAKVAGPKGVAWGKPCNAIAGAAALSAAWPAPGLQCWSLI